MAGPAILALAELTDGQPTRLSLELATLASDLATAAGGAAVVACIGSGAGDAAAPLARHAERTPDRATTELRRLRRLRQAVEDVFGAIADRTDIPEPGQAALRRAAEAHARELYAVQFRRAAFEGCLDAFQGRPPGVR